MFVLRVDESALNS